MILLNSHTKCTTLKITNTCTTGLHAQRSRIVFQRLLSGIDITDDSRRLYIFYMLIRFRLPPQLPTRMPTASRHERCRFQISKNGFDLYTDDALISLWWILLFDEASGRTWKASVSFSIIRWNGRRQIMYYTSYASLRSSFLTTGGRWTYRYLASGYRYHLNGILYIYRQASPQRFIGHSQVIVISLLFLTPARIASQPIVVPRSIRERISLISRHLCLPSEKIPFYVTVSPYRSGLGIEENRVYSQTEYWLLRCYGRLSWDH
jgi:hypothetical protein